MPDARLLDNAPLRAAEFPWASRRVYLNHASIGPIPAAAQAAIDAVEAKRRDPIEFTDGELMDILVRARAAAARLVHADPGEIALASNTSYGISVTALALPLEPGDVVLVPDGEFPANVYPWLMLERRGVRVELVPRTAQGWPDEARLLDRLTDPAVRAVAVSYVQFANGYRVDLDRLGRACRAEGAFLVVDAIQGLGQCPLDVRTTPVDVLSCGAQKWLLSPWGSGFLYVRRGLIADLAPPLAGWMAFEGTDDFSRLTAYDTTPRDDARRFELVTLPFQDLAGMIASVELLCGIGIERIAAHLTALRAPVDAAAAQGRLAVVSPTDAVHGTGIWCVRLPDLTDAFGRLRAAGVAASLREGSIRLSPHAYNTVDEIVRAVDLLTAP